MPRRLFTITNTFLIRGRGLIPVPGLVPVGDEKFRVGDPIVLRRPDGSEVCTFIGGIEMLSPNNGQGFPLLLKDFAKDDVPIGTEVWSVDRNPGGG